MSKKSRYILLLICFAIFFSASPAVLLYVTGIKYDFKTRQFIKTGVLAIKIEPEDATLFLNKKKIKPGTESIKFLLPGEYEVKISKPGFAEWSNKYTIKPGEVTWVHPKNEKIYLFKSDPQIFLEKSKVSDIVTDENKIAILREDGVELSDFSGKIYSRFYTDTKNYDKIEELGENSGFYLLKGKNSYAILNLETQSIKTISTKLSPQSQFLYLDNKFFVLDNSSLFLLKENGNNLLWTDTFLTQIYAAASLNNSLYYIQQSKTENHLFYQNSLRSKAISLSEIAFNFETANIFLNKQKNIYLLLNQTLFRLDSGLVKAYNNVSFAEQSQDKNNIFVGNNFELAYFNSDFPEAIMLTRSSDKIKSPILLANLGKVFFIQHNSLIVQDAQTSKKQNQLAIFSGAEIKKALIDSDGKNAAILDGETLKFFSIR